MAILSTSDTWLWDPFNFYTGVIPEGFFKSIELTNTDAELDVSVSDLTDSHAAWKHTIELTGFQGKKPQCPLIYWVPKSTPSNTTISRRRATLTLDYVNNSIGINYNAGKKYKMFEPFVVYGGNYTGSENTSLTSIGIDYLGTYTHDIFGQADTGAGKYYPADIGNKTVYIFRDNDFILYDAYMRQNAYARFRGNGYLTIEFNRGDL